MRIDRVVLLSLSWLIVGLAVMLLGFAGLLSSWSPLLLLLPLAALSITLKDYRIGFLSGILALVWLSHSIQIFTPETGFDAVWYHLPVAKLITQLSGFVYTSSLYQSVNPLFSDGIFVLGYQWFGEIGAKLIAYFFGLSLVIVTYYFARLFMTKRWSMLTVILVSLIQVVAWQASSYYVDVAKAFWEIAAMYVVVRYFIGHKKVNQWHIVLLGLLFGASLGTKLFSILLIPFFIYVVWAATHSWKITRKTIAISLLAALPYYLFAYIHTGDLFYGITHAVGILDNIGNTPYLSTHLWQRTATLPFSLLKILIVRDYISPLLILVGLPFLLIKRKTISADPKLFLPVLFVLYQWLMWWFIPPLSTRYALSGFIILIMLIVYLLYEISVKSISARIIAYTIIACSIVLLILPRIIVNIRSMYFIAGYQTKKEYLDQFLDGNINDKLMKWHEDVY